METYYLSGSPGIYLDMQFDLIFIDVIFDSIAGEEEARG